MNLLLKKLLFVPLLLLLVSFTAFHHGWANYNQNKVLDYTVTIEESVYENPHASIKVKQSNQVWLVILAPTSRMSARGVTSEMIEKGKTVRVVGYPHKTVKNEMRAERIFINGEKYELR